MARVAAGELGGIGNGQGKLREVAPMDNANDENDRGDPLRMSTSLASNKEGFLGFASGLVAGVIGVLTGYPLDTLKVKMQVYGSGAHVSLLDGTAGRNPVKVIRQLFRGVLPPLASTGLVQTLNFGVYDNTLRYLRAQRALEQETTVGNAATTAATVGAAAAIVNGNTLSDYFLAGSVGGAAISVITCPASLVKIQVQTATSSSVTYWTILAGMRRKGLVAGYYRAFLPDILNQMFGRGVYMCTYEGLKRVMRPPPTSSDPSLLLPPLLQQQQQQQQQMQPQPLYQRIVAGALAGISGWLVIYPLDVIKSRLQADALAPGQNKYASMTDCFRVSYRQGGMRSLYSGLGFTLLRAVPVASVILPCYDATYYLLSQYVDE